MKRKVNAIWNGNGSNGNGLLTAQSGAFDNMPYSFKTRFENENGELGTNPEELIAGALAGCFNMKLAFVLNEADFNPAELNTDALLIFNDGSITSIELFLKGNGFSLIEFEEKFKQFEIYFVSLWVNTFNSSGCSDPTALTINPNTERTTIIQNAM